MPEALKGEIEQAAALMGISLTAFFSMAAVERAREVKAQHASTVLNNEERDAFLTLMTSPPSPNPALHRLMRTEVEL
jgi:uncharacterized protein (DUF1778 family)